MNEEITTPGIEKIKEEKNFGSYAIYPLFPGFGVTIGNSLRRILYSSMDGAAIYSIKVTGATHEFSAIPGVKEDLIQIILNLKKIRLQLHEGEEATLKLDAKGLGIVTAKDIKCPSSVEIINKDLPIATLSKTGKLIMELKVNKGLGYLPVESREEEKNPIGTIAIDAIYTPVQKVNYTIDQTRVGKVTNYDKLTLDITTDGTVSPTEVLKKSAEILISQFELIKNFKTKSSKPAKAKKIEEKIVDIKSAKIEDAGFANRTVNALISNKIKTVAGLARLSDDKIKEMKGLGDKGREEIINKLKSWNLK
jgi:DNA-directed RNA polymerase subunit alpha